MAFFIASSPHAHNRKSTPDLMKWVAICALPGLIVQTYTFGWGTIIQLILAVVVAMGLEALTMEARKRPPISALRDKRTVTAWLLAIAIRSSPWWIVVIGLIFAIVVSKQLYGGIGQNLFNPAMVAYVVLLISFPVQMTSWISPQQLQVNSMPISDALSLIFTGFDSEGLSLQQIRSGIDGVTMATPLDALKTSLVSGNTISEALTQPQFSGLAGIGWEWVNLAYLLGGLALLKLRIISWHIPIGFLVSLHTDKWCDYATVPGTTGSPILHLLSGATMLGHSLSQQILYPSTTVRVGSYLAL